MKKYISMILVAVMALTTMILMTGCGSDSSSDMKDSEYVADQGKLIVGITDFEPMDYKDRTETGLDLMRIWLRLLQSHSE